MFMKLGYFVSTVGIYLITLPNRSFCQNAPIDSAERERERIRWNLALVKDTSYHFKKEVNSFLAASIKDRKPGKAVDVGMGQGRNAIYLAKMGWDVTGYDIADEALNYAKTEAAKQNVKLTVVQQGSEEFNFGNEQWDLISFIYEGCMEDVPGLAERMKKGLKKNGIIVFEFFHRDAGIAMGRNDFGCLANAEKDVLLKVGGFKIITYLEKFGISDYGLENFKLIDMVAEKY
jgi:SAM-dependent methyltransferase